MRHFWLFFFFCFFLLLTSTRCQYLQDLPLSSPLNNVWTTPLNLSFDTNLTISNTSLVYLQFTVILMSPTEFAPQVSGALNSKVTAIFYPPKYACIAPAFQFDFTDIVVYSGAVLPNTTWPLIAGVLPVLTTSIPDGWYNLTLTVQADNGTRQEWYSSPPVTVHLATRTPPLLIYSPLPNQSIWNEVDFTFWQPFVTDGPLLFQMFNSSQNRLLELFLFNETGLVNVPIQLFLLNLTVGEEYSFSLTYSDTSGHPATTMTVGGLTYIDAAPVAPSPSPSPSPSAPGCPDVTVNTLWLSVPIYGWLLILLIGEPLAFVLLLLLFIFVRKIARRRFVYERAM